MKKNRGFTLLELMVVVIVVAILAALAIPSYIKQTRKARRNAAESSLQQIAVLEERYRADNSSYLAPTSTATWAQLGMSDPSGTYFTYTVTASAASGVTPALYSVTAAAKGDQAKDTGCTSLAYTQTYDTTNNIVNTSTTPSTCWNK